MNSPSMIERIMNDILRVIGTAAVAVSCTMFNGCGNGNGDAIEASGTLEAVEVSVSARTPGQLERLAAREGSVLREGDTVAVIEHGTLRLQLRQAEAGVALAQSQLELLRNGARSEDLAAAEEVKRQTESAFRTASSDFDRIKELYASSSVPKKQYEDAESRRTIAEAQYNAASQNLLKLRRFARPEEVAAAAARVEQAKAAADLVRRQITDAVVLAPASGTVTYQPAEQGELVGAGGVLVRLSRLESLELMIYVNETELGRVALGAPAAVSIDTYPDRSYEATVVYISPNAEFTPRNVQTKDERTKLVFGVKLRVDNASGDLKPGMPADAVLR